MQYTNQKKVKIDLRLGPVFNIATSTIVWQCYKKMWFWVLSYESPFYQKENGRLLQGAFVKMTPLLNHYLITFITVFDQMLKKSFSLPI